MEEKKEYSIEDNVKSLLFAVKKDILKELTLIRQALEKNNKTNDF